MLILPSGCKCLGNYDKVYLLFNIKTNPIEYILQERLLEYISSNDFILKMMVAKYFSKIDGIFNFLNVYLERKSMLVILYIFRLLLG